MKTTKSILDDLNAPPSACQYRTVLEQFPRANVAARLGVSSSHITNVLNGFSAPGKQLEKRIAALVQEIQEAQQAG